MDTTAGVSGIVIVPWAPEAAWWPLMRHMTCVARFPSGSKHLEENRAGIWVPVTARRPSLAMSFPLNLGTVLPLDAVVNKQGDEGPKVLLPGTLLYSLMRVPPEEAATRGAELAALADDPALQARRGQKEREHNT